MQVFLRRKSLGKNMFFFLPENTFLWISSGNDIYLLCLMQSDVCFSYVKGIPKSPKPKDKRKETGSTFTWLKQLHILEIRVFCSNKQSWSLVVQAGTKFLTHLCHIYILNFWPHLAVDLIQRRVSRTVKHSEKDLKNRKTSIILNPSSILPWKMERVDLDRMSR